MIYSFAWLTPSAENSDAVYRSVSKAAKLIKGEEGNRGVTIGRQGLNVTIAEQWATRRDFTAHQEGPILAAVAADTLPLMETPLVINELNPWAF